MVNKSIDRIYSIDYHLGKPLLNITNLNIQIYVCLSVVYVQRNQEKNSSKYISTLVNLLLLLAVESRYRSVH